MHGDWFVMLRDARSVAASVHYATKEEAYRIARAAHSIGAVVIDGPRPLTRWESLSAQDKTTVARDLFA